MNSNEISIDSSLEKRIVRCETKLNELILTNFDFSELEKALMNYATNIVIPLQMQHPGFEKHFEPIKINDPSIAEYAQLYIDRFSQSLNTDTKQFTVEIWHSKQILGMFFKVVTKETNQKNIVWIDKSKEDLLATAIKLSSQKITDKLFVQKDLRGFEKEFFYIFKPNEKRLWHKAIGYQDVDEFMDAILKTSRRAFSGK